MERWNLFMDLKKHRGVTLAISIFLLLSLFVAGCGTPKTTTNPSTNSPTNTTSPNPSNSGSDNTIPTSPTTPSSSVKVTVYFPTSDAAGLVPVERTVTVTNQDVIRALFKEFSNPPSGLVAPLPKGTELLDDKIKDGIATINLSKTFKSNFEGGATGEQMVLYSIVNSLTSLPNVKSVEFLLEGQQTVAILGQLDTSSPVKRNESLIIKQ
jgi:spore germination protein GerM